MYKSVEYRSFSTTRKFGVEVEMGNEVSKRKILYAIKRNSFFKVKTARYEPSINNDYWHIKDDSSCGALGWEGKPGVEVASPVGEGYIDLTHICNVFSSLSEIGCKVNKNCGIHVHVDVSDFSYEEVVAVMAYWIKIEHRFSHALPFNRINNEYTCYMQDNTKNENLVNFERRRLYSPGDLWDQFCPDMSKIWEYVERNTNLNIINYALALGEGYEKRTLEFRWPESSLSRRNIVNWIRLFVNFVENAGSLPMPKDLKPVGIDEMLNILGLGHNDKFLLLSPGLKETKTWFLERMIKYYHQYPYLERKRQTERACYILNRMWQPVKKYSFEYCI